MSRTYSGCVIARLTIRVAVGRGAVRLETLLELSDAVLDEWADDVRRGGMQLDLLELLDDVPDEGADNVRRGAV